MKTAFLTIVLFLISFHAFSEEKVLYCQAEHATGIFFDKNINSFKTGGFVLERYTLKFKGDYSNLLGWGSSNMECKRDSRRYTDDVSKNTVLCSNPQPNGGESLMYNFVTRRFIGTSISQYGYTNPEPQKTYYDTNSLIAGKCEDF